jgi:hypothetical protein
MAMQIIDNSSIIFEMNQNTVLGIEYDLVTQSASLSKNVEAHPFNHKAILSQTGILRDSN